MNTSPFPLCLVLILGCADGTLGPLPPDPDPDPDPGDLTAAALYDPDHIVEIEIEMLPADAAALASETNDIFTLLQGADCMDSPWSGPFNWYPGDIRVDGVLVEQVGLRKKGLIGSLSSTRPSFKVKFDKYVADQSFGGLERLTLNNSISDPTLVKQCLGYRLFEEAGIPAPRCNFAHVVAQGTDLGIYVNVEPLKRRFLRHNFDGDDRGDLYEGTLSDFRPGWTGTFEPDTGSTDPSLGPILAVTDALALLDDDDAIDALERALDLDAFHRFWAMEVLIAHWDGYTGNRNNYYVYRPSGSDRLEFLPWGIDGILYSREEEQVTLANSALPNRLWSIPTERDRYLETLEELLDAVWDTDALLASIDDMVDLVEPFALDDDRRLPETEALRAFVAQRRDRVTAAIDAPLPTIDLPAGESVCLVEAGALNVAFDATWDTLGSSDPLSRGWSLVTGDYHGEAINLEGAAVAGLSGGNVLVATLALDGPSTVREVVAWIPTWQLGAEPIALGGFGAGAYLVDVDITTDPPVSTTLGSLWNGSFQFTQLEGVPDGPVRGSFQGTLYDGGP